MIKRNIFKIIIFIFSCLIFSFSFGDFDFTEEVVNINIDKPIYDVNNKHDEKDYITVKNSEIYKNDNYVLNLKIFNTDFVEPVYQYIDNDYYLTHDGLGRKKSSGATYMDYRVNIDSRKILIYGHNNDKLSLPFSVLENYNDYEYYKEHNYLYLEVEDDLYKYEIFSVYIETYNWDYMKVDFTSNKQWYKHLSDLKERSIYDTGVSISEDDNILILQTCSKNSDYKKYSKKYMLVIGKLVEE